MQQEQGKKFMSKIRTYKNVTTSSKTKEKFKRKENQQNNKWFKTTEQSAFMLCKLHNQFAVHLGVFRLRPK